MIDEMNITFSNLKNQSLTPKPTGKICPLYSMKTWTEYGIPFDGSFSQTIAFDAPINGTGGVTNRLRLKKTEIDFIKSLNTAPGLKSWAWAADSPTGLYYQSRPGESIDKSVDWNWVGTPSGRPYDRNIMCFSSFQNGLAQVVAAPRSSNYEFARNIPWLIQRIWGNYRDGTPENSWNSGPHLWNTLLFDPASGFETTKGQRGFWIDQNWLFEKVGEAQVP